MNFVFSGFECLWTIWTFYDFTYPYHRYVTYIHTCIHTYIHTSSASVDTVFCKKISINKNSKKSKKEKKSRETKYSENANNTKFIEVHYYTKQYLFKVTMWYLFLFFEIFVIIFHYISHIVYPHRLWIFNNSVLTFIKRSVDVNIQMIAGLVLLSLSFKHVSVKRCFSHQWVNKVDNFKAWNIQKNMNGLI